MLHVLLGFLAVGRVTNVSFRGGLPFGRGHPVLSRVLRHPTLFRLYHHANIPLVTPTSRYNELIENGTLRKDRHQRSIVAKLQTLHDHLRTYEQPLPTEVVQQTPGFVRSFCQIPEI